MKKETRRAEIISVVNAPFINPQGQVLSGVTRSGAPVHLAGTSERYKVTFRYDDDSQFEGTLGILNNMNNYEVGSKGILTVKGNEILAWEPFQNGEESEEALISLRQKKRRRKVTVVAIAGLILIAAAVWIFLMYGLTTPVSGILESEDGNAVEIIVSTNRRMKVNIQNTHFMIVNYGNTSYRIELPTTAEQLHELRKMQNQANDPDSGIRNMGYWGGQEFNGQIFEINDSVSKEILYGNIQPSGISIRITGTSDSDHQVNIEWLAAKLSFSK